MKDFDKTWEDTKRETEGIMKKYNCIVVFNEDKTKLLFCRRKKEPFIDRYNFVGGKIENGDPQGSYIINRIQYCK